MKKKLRNKNGKSNHYDFANFSKSVSDAVGSAGSFIFAFILVILWLLSGPIFGYSDTWQLIINTGTTIITFLMVFLIQHTQTRDTEILNLKLDELIKSNKKADNLSLDLDVLSDEELKELQKEYETICNKKKKKLKEKSIQRKE